MMLDAGDLPDGQFLTADVCIVGAGAAGISMALQFCGSDIDVLVLESGSLQEEPATQNLYAGSVSDPALHSPIDRYRQRRFGGTSTIWGGRCMPFDDIDFEARDYIPASGWPIRREALLPYYEQANRLCEAGEFTYDAEHALRDPRPMIAGFDSPHFSSNTIERFSCPTDFGARYGQRLLAADNVTVLLHANVTAVHLHADGRSVDALSVRTLKGRSFRARASHYVLASGGLEVPRLLLASRDVQSCGIGNAYDLVGRYYMCHLAGTIGRLRIDGPVSAVHHGYDVSDEGVYCRRRLALRDTVQRSRQLGNFVARLHHPRITDPEHRNAVLSLLYLAKPFIPYEYGKRLHGERRAGMGEWLAHVRNVVTGPFDAAAFAWHMLRYRRFAERKFPSIIVQSKANLYSLDFHAEQQPNRDSRITLTDAVDALGMPRLHVDWRYTRGDVDTVERSLALLAEDFRRGAVGHFDYDPAAVEFEMTRYGAYGGHHIGTARMGASPRGSVVNANCRLHEVDNLYIVGSATFATSSQANPTLTVVALALRLAQHLKDQMRRPVPVAVPDSAEISGLTGATASAPA